MFKNGTPIYGSFAKIIYTITNLPEKNFLDVDLSNIVFADERCAYGAELPTDAMGAKYIFVGPEGGFSEKEFAAFDAAGAKGISLGKTILRAELAAAIAISRVIL